MPKRLFDSNKLIAQLRKLKGNPTHENAKGLAHELIRIYGTDAILTPVEIEVLAGVRDSHDLKLTETFLKCFKVVDSQQILKRDWEAAKRIAKRVLKYELSIPGQSAKRARKKNPETEPRQFADCLISALAKRLGYEVITDDKGMIRQAGRAGPGTT